MDAAFEKQLQESLYIHYPLKADESRTLEAGELKKQVLAEHVMWDGRQEKWSAEGSGSLSFTEEGLQLKTNIRESFWQENESQRGEYATFGDYTAFLNVSETDWSSYSRLIFDIKPECMGLHSPMLRVGYENKGKEKIPDRYTREGFHAISLKNHQWNTCVWDITELPHDSMTKVLFRIHKYGKETSAGETLKFQIRNIKMQKVENPCVTKGWKCEKDTVSYSTSGYFTDGQKRAVVHTDSSVFSLHKAEGDACVFSGSIENVTSEAGTFQVIDFTDVREDGMYYIRVGLTRSYDFPIGRDILESAVWKLINFLFCERCGFPVPDKHGACHLDTYAVHQGKTIIFNGGWHDAADVSQQTTQTAEIADSLMELAERVKENTPLYLRLLEEAHWGMDFVLRTRLGEGYRATHALMRRWTDNQLGSFDDVVDVRTHNNAFDNFVTAGVEAAAARAFNQKDRELAWKCLESAKEDFCFAREVLEKEGIKLPTRGEHTLNAGISLHYAQACLAACEIYQSSRESFYEEMAAEYMNRMLDCQDRGEAGIFLSGFFYRDADKKAIVHFNHQSREFIFAKALTRICRVLPNHSEKVRWTEAMKAHGEYLKQLMRYSSPYGMIPAGLYSMEELEDEETFHLLHPRLDFEEEKPNYLEQLQNGVKIDETYCIRHFPVWFSFRGNSAVLLAMGKAAALMGDYLEDPELTEIGREQAYWMLGKNPFGQSLIYGEGANYAGQYTALCGETVGEMPVGIETRGNEDVPYWPMGNIATYKEIWASVAGHFLRLAADL